MCSNARLSSSCFRGGGGYLLGDAFLWEKEQSTFLRLISSCCGFSKSSFKERSEDHFGVATTIMEYNREDLFTGVQQHWKEEEESEEEEEGNLLHREKGWRKLTSSDPTDQRSRLMEKHADDELKESTCVPTQSHPSNHNNKKVRAQK